MLSIPNTNNLSTIAERIVKQTGHYDGGPPQLFERAGRDTFITALLCGLLPYHTLLDFGCGSLRLGYWFIRFLDPDCYFGIDPVRTGVEAGKIHAIGQDLLQIKRPSFAFTESCEMSLFKTRFHFVIARSIFTHMGPGLLRKSLQSFADTAVDDGIMLASYWPATGENACTLEGHFGNDLPSGDVRFSRVVTYTFEYMQQRAHEAGLKVHEFIPMAPINQQIWLKFERS
jgi:hypothetical protein